MSVIYLKHDIHGTKVATSDLEAFEDKKHGWKPFDPNEKKEDKDEHTNALKKK